MADSIAGALFLTVAVIVVVAPGVLLFLGWRDLRDRNYERADTRATLAAMASVGQFALAGLLGLLVVLVGEGHPASLAIVAVPAALWVLTRRLHRSIRIRRAADRRP